MELKRIFFHDLGSEFDHPTNLFTGITYREFGHYASRAFVMASGGDIVLMPNNKRSHSAIEVIPFLNEVGIGPKTENIFFIGPSNGIIEDLCGCLPILKNIGCDGVILPFTGMSELPHRLAIETGLQISSPVKSLVRLVNGKDFFQLLVNNSIPEGNIFEHLEEADIFFRNLNGFKWIAKTAHNASGLSASVIQPNGQGVSEAMVFFANDETGKLVVQQWYEHDCSPSVNLVIQKNGTIIPLFISDQLLSGSGQGVPVHEGNIYPANLSQEVITLILSKSFSIARKIWKKAKYFGPLGVDWVINKKDPLQAKAVEVNPRITAPRYGFAVMQKLGASAFVMTNVRFTPGTSAYEMRNELDYLFFNPKIKKGIIFFNFSHELGKMVVVSLGRCREEALEYANEVKEIVE